MAKKVFNMQGGLHSAAAYSALENRAWGSCVASTGSLVAAAAAGMNISVSTGDGLISVDSFNARRIQVTAAETVAVPAANASFNRIDTLVAYIDNGVAPTTAVVDNVNDVLKFMVVAGTAAATPAAPTGAAIQAAIGAGNPYMALYDLLVPQAATNTAGVTFTDRRKVLTDIVDLSVTTAKLAALAVTNAKLAANSLTAGKINQSDWLTLSRFYDFRTSGNQSTTSSATQQLATNIGNVQVSHTTRTGRVKVRCSLPIGNSANNMQVDILLNGASNQEIANFSKNDATFVNAESYITGLTPGTTYTIGLGMRVDGGATASLYAFRKLTLIVEDY